MRPQLRLLPGATAIDPATNENILAAQAIIRESLEGGLTREEYRQECNEYWEELERQKQCEPEFLPFYVDTLTRDSFGYRNDRIEARYEHDLMCSPPIEDVDSGMQFLAENDCMIDQKSRQELAHSIAANDSAVIHIDIATECVYLTVYHIVPTEALNLFPFSKLLVAEKKKQDIYGGGGGCTPR